MAQPTDRIELPPLDQEIDRIEERNDSRNTAKEGEQSAYWWWDYFDGL